MTPQTLLETALQDHRYSWSIGTSCEFMRGADEAVISRSENDIREMVTDRGGIRLHLRDDFQIVAYEILGDDGETWDNAIAICLPLPDFDAAAGVSRLGPDTGALRPGDAGDMIYDLGTGFGDVSMCIRTAHPDLQAALDRLEGLPLRGPAGSEASALLLQHAPHRIMLSPAGRIEVYAPRASADGSHSSDAPIPYGLQPVLMLHPPSPWRTSSGVRTPYDPDLAARFDEMLIEFGPWEDRVIRMAVGLTIRHEIPAESFEVPPTPRGRAQMRIAVRRLAQTLGREAVAGWEIHDPAH